MPAGGANSLIRLYPSKIFLSAGQLSFMEQVHATVTRNISPDSKPLNHQDIHCEPNMAYLTSLLCSLWKSACLGMLILILPGLMFAQETLPAFPGAEGAGAYATGGRNGSVFIVNTLNDNGWGSLSDAVSQSNRFIIFAVSGVIDFDGLDLKIEDVNNITIAGQTAPGEGICIKDATIKVKNANNIIMRHIRCRPGYNEKHGAPDHRDAYTIKEGKNIILDHVSASWGTDENLSPWGEIDSVTVQNVIISEALNYYDPNNQPNRHGLGCVIGSKIGGTVSWHHSLLAHHERRSPRFSGVDDLADTIDFRNNVIYNPRTIVGINRPGNQIHANYVGNYLKPGPDTADDIQAEFFLLQSNEIQMYAVDNYAVASQAVTDNNWIGMSYDDGGSEIGIRVQTPFPVPPIQTDEPADLYVKVLADAGATLPARDPVDLRITREVESGTGQVIEYETDLPFYQRWPVYYELPVLADSDSDGLPDYWEQQYSAIDESNDGMVDSDDDGYVDIEEYVNNTTPDGGNHAIVFVSASDSRAYEQDADPGEILFQRTGNTTTAVSVNYQISGTATADEDFAALSGTVSFDENETAVAVPVNVVADDYEEPIEKVIVTLDVPDDGYKVCCPNRALVVIEDTPQMTGTADEPVAGMPESPILYPNYPNPFNSSTIVRFHLPKSTQVKITIYDVTGKPVRTLLSNDVAAGQHVLHWDGLDRFGHTVASGIYFCRMETNSHTSSQKLMLMK